MQRTRMKRRTQAGTLVTMAHLANYHENVAVDVLARLERLEKLVAEALQAKERGGGGE